MTENQPEDGSPSVLEELELLMFQDSADDIPEKDEADMATKDPMEEIQTEMAWMKSLLVQGIARIDPSARSALEVHLADRWM